jgi:flavin reductase (DIM6/NTAB) family NADH-FMN oxidoreductase RutF
MTQTFFDLEKSDAGFNYRWVQPPQIAYLVSTVDPLGNNNITPVTLGTCVGVNSLPSPKSSNYYFAFSVGSRDVEDIPARGAYHNLETTPECVISFPGSDLLEQVWVMGLPVPPGIDETLVAGLTPLKSRNVKPAGIVECPVNIEAKVTASYPAGEHYQLYICQVVGVAVDADVLKIDINNPLHYGILNIDPIFETAIAAQDKLPPRLYFGKIDRDNLIRTSDEIGAAEKWLGTFEEWMDAECTRGKISDTEKSELLKLYESWIANPDPAQNSEIKKSLTGKLAEIMKK